MHRVPNFVYYEREFQYLILLNIIFCYIILRLKINLYDEFLILYLTYMSLVQIKVYYV